jgi:DNA-binding transcriptional LysR family regulator
MAQLENFRVVVFRAVAEQMSFRKAAEALYLTQPAVSQQIKALEEELGVQLFERGGRGIRLTEAGVVLFDGARRAGAVLEQTGGDVAALGGIYAGPFLLGASTTIAQYVLPAVVGAFRQKHPGIRPSLLSGNTEHIVEAVARRTVALGFIEGPPRSTEVKTEPFLRDELVLIAPALHAWAKRGSITPSALSEAPLLLREHGSGTRRIVELAFERAKIKLPSLQIAMEFDATEAIKSAVEAGFGAGFVSRWAIAKDLRLGKSFKIVTIEGMRIERSFLLTMPHSPALQGLAREFRNFLLEHVQRRRKQAHR